LLASLTRSNPSTGPDRLASIRSRLILGLLLPYVCLMGVCAVALFAGPADTNRIPAILVLVAAAILVPAAMARIARSILRQAEALETERATLAAGQSLRDERVESRAEPVEAVEADAEPALDAVAATPAEPADAVTGTDDDDVAAAALLGDIDEDAPLAAAVGTDAAADALDGGGPFAAFVAGERRSRAFSSAADNGGEPAVPSEPEAVDEAAAAPEAVDEDAPIAAAVASPEPAAAAGDDAPPPEAGPRPMLMPSAIGRQDLTGTPAEPAA
jgi:hypothetical protein